MQPPRHHLFLFWLRASFRSCPSRCVVALSAAAGIWLTSISADGAGLAIQKSGDNQYSVSWPGSISQAFSLYSRTDLVNGAWIPVAGMHTLVGDQWQISCSTSAPQMFFRLQTTLRTDPSNPRYFNNGTSTVFLT